MDKFYSKNVKRRDQLENNTKIYSNEIGFEDVDWVRVAQDGLQL
jgi:hypothetical protein